MKKAGIDLSPVDGPRDLRKYLVDEKGVRQGTFTEWNVDPKTGEVYTKIGQYKDGIEDGDTAEFYSNSNLKSITPHSNGKIVGNVKEFYPNGKPKSIIPYVDGKPEGIGQVFYEQGGESFVEYKNGVEVARAPTREAITRHATSPMVIVENPKSAEKTGTVVSRSVEPAKAPIKMKSRRKSSTTKELNGQIDSMAGQIKELTEKKEALEKALVKKLVAKKKRNKGRQTVNQLLRDTAKKYPQGNLRGAAAASRAKNRKTALQAIVKAYKASQVKGSK